MKGTTMCQYQCPDNLNYFVMSAGAISSNFEPFMSNILAYHFLFLFFILKKKHRVY
jgi:hypothetical protein